MDVSLIPLSLYIHTPWCVKKCPYCDFNSHERDSLPEADYLNALIDDLKQDAHLSQGRTIETIFIGGGTPSLLSADFYQQLLSVISSELNVSASVEITLEANPGTVEQQRFDGYRHAGINRLSIGVQSFNSEKLKALGRIHGASEAIMAAECARQAGFDNFNLDLMHGLPAQTVNEAMDDLQQAIALQPTHLSWYELTIEPNTAFYSAPPRQPDPDAMADTEEAGFALLQKHDFQRYEISAFAQPGKQCRHNLNYWQFGDYLAIGAGAHGKITSADGQIIRYQKTRKPEHYLTHIQRSRQQAPLNQEHIPLEFCLNALRLTEGVSWRHYSERTGQPVSELQRAIKPAQQKGLIKHSDQHLCCTDLGLQHLNATLELLAQ